MNDGDRKRTTIGGRCVSIALTMGISWAVGMAAVDVASAADWPTRLRDVRRGGVTPERLVLPLTEVWTHRTPRAPAPAWTESPARHDYLHNFYDLKPRQGFDRCSDVAVVGGFVYFGSSNSGAVTCLSAKTGETVWTHFTEAPVRFAPHVEHGRVYVGSDDGCVYCLDAKTGSVVWRERSGPTDAMIWGNQQMISPWPVRGGVLVDGDDAFWSAGIFPEEGMVLCKRNAADGKGGWTVTPKRPIQGYLLATDAHLFAPTGKTYPAVYARQDGAHVGDIKANTRDGGSWALIAPEGDRVWSGPGIGNTVGQFDANRRAHIASVGGANTLIADPTWAYYNTDTKIVKINRRDRSVAWQIDQAYPYALIKAGDALIAGGDGRVAAFDADGQRVWTAEVDGKAYGLAVAGGALYVSTDTGSIHRFAATLPYIANAGAILGADASLARLSADLVSAGGTETASISVYWGTTDGGADASRWTHSKSLGARGPGAISVDVARPSAATTCYYRFCATNSYGQTWAPRSRAFITGAVTIRASDAEASERGLDTGTFVVSRPAGAAASALTVNYTVGGSGRSGEDFEPLSGTVTIEKGATSASIAVKPIDDLFIAEPPETVAVTLAAGGYAIGSPSSATVTIADRDDLVGWPYKMKIRFSGYDRRTAVTDFPALIVLDEALTGLAYEQFATTEAADLRFTDAAGSHFLHYEIESWNAKGRSQVWVQVPEISGPDDHIWAYWGNVAKSQPPGGPAVSGTWSNAYAGVWHLGERRGTYRDSTQNANHGTPEHDVVQGEAGVIAGAAHFDGEDDQITLASRLPIGKTSSTLSAWVKVPVVGEGGLKPNERVGIVLGNFGSRPSCNWEFHNAGQMRTFWNNGKIDELDKTDLRDGAWHHVAWTRDRQADRHCMYIDGRRVNTVDRAGLDVFFDSTHKIGGDNRPNPPNFHGTLDEVRISKVARSDDWIWACWMSQRSGGRFVTYDPAQSIGSGKR